MADFIDREAVLTKIYQYTRHYWPTVSYVESIIKEQPAADVEPVKRWIPCSERLPESCTDATYLAYVPSFGAVDIADYHPDVDEWDFMGLPVTVTHWMPLPEPPEMDGGAENGRAVDEG